MSNATLDVPNGIVGLRNGQLLGWGYINCYELSMGWEPGTPEYVATNPCIMPGNMNGVGTLYVNASQRMRMFSGELHMEIAGSGPGPVGGIYQYDRIQVTGDAWLGGKLVGYLLGPVTQIDAGTRFPVLTYRTRLNDFVDVIKTNLGVGWNHGTTDLGGNPPSGTYWFEWPGPGPIPAKQGIKVSGIVFRDDGALPGIFEPAADGLVAGITVNLRDATGANVIASTTTNATGAYEFANLAAGQYVVEFVRPNGERFTLADQGNDNTVDSDPDQITGEVLVSVYDDVVDVFAGLYANADPVANNDSFLAHLNTAIAGDVLANDTDADGDSLTASLIASPLHGVLSLNSDGSFTYSPHTGWYGQDTFVYAVADGYGGTSSASVYITVANTPAPVGSDDSYSAPADLFVDAANGVLANDTNPNSSTLTAVLVSGPTNGTLTLNADGSFSYTPDDSFVGADSFTYRPHDDDGPGTLATATIDVTDTPPVANDDAASTDQDTAVAIDVLANDTDADFDTLTVIGASDGIYGTTTVNTDGTVTYTPPEGWSGTDWFTYVIDDGYGRLAYASVTVAVTPTQTGTGTITGRVWNDLDHDGIQDAGIEEGFGGPQPMDPIPSGEPGLIGIQVWLLDANDTIIATTWTNAGGEYTFTNVAPGQYKIRVDVAGYTVSSKDEGTNDLIDSDISSMGDSDLFTVNPGSLFDIDAGLYTGP